MLKKLVQVLGYEVRARRWRASLLAQLCRPRTVVDVGAGFGTPELYRAFPGARFLLIEPLREYQPYLERLARQCGGTVYYQALGSREEVREILVDADILTRTSFQERTALTATGSRLEKRQIEVTTLDRLLELNPGLEAPILLKIDTEGHELEVIRGGERFLERTEVVIAEVSVAERFREGYSFAELVGELDRRGFAAFDFLRVSYLPGGRAGARMADVVFRRKEGLAPPAG